MSRLFQVSYPDLTETTHGGVPYQNNEDILTVSDKNISLLLEPFLAASFVS